MTESTKEKTESPLEILRKNFCDYLNEKSRKWIRYQTAIALSDNDHFICMRDTEELYQYSGGVYEENGETYAKEKIRGVWMNECTKHDVSEILAMVKEMNYDERKNFNLGNKVPLENGILDVETKEIESFSPDKKYTFKLPVKCDPDADCPKIKKFVSEIVEGVDVNVIQEMIGYCLIQDYRFNKAFMLIGCGSNGKSTLMKLISHFIGEENVATPSLQELCYNQFAKAELYGKLANIHSDMSSAGVTRSGNFKMLTGEDLIRGEKKHRDSFIFTNHAKLLYSANELPRSEDTTDAFFRRWILVKFPYVFEGENCDPKKLDSLRSEEELSGLLNWALEGLTRIIKQGGFSMTQSRDSIKDEWIMQTDSLKAFVDKCVKTDADGLITKDFFYDSYTDFCDEYDLTPEDKALVGRRLPTILPGVKVRRVGPRGNRSRAWVGLVIEQENELDGGIVGGDGKTTHMGKQETLRDSSVHKVHDFSHLSQKKYSNTYILSDVDTGLHGHKDTIMDTPTPLNFWAFLNDCIKPDELIEKELLIVDAGEKGYTPEFVEDCLEKFKLEGRVYEPKAGFFKLIK